MNPLTNVKNITKLNERELQLGLNEKTSWHNQYKDSAWLFIGGLPFDLTEGDIICIFSQYGEIVNINLVRDKKTGKSRGFCFLCYENQKSTILAVDNFNGIKVLGRTIRVDHVSNYKPPKEHEDDDEALKALHNQGCAPRLPQPPPAETILTKPKAEKPKKKKKEKKKKKHKKRAAKSSSSETSSSEDDNDDVNRRRKTQRTSNPSHKDIQEPVRVKTEKHDPGYDKYERTERRDRSPDTRRGHKTRRSFSPESLRDKRRHTDGRERHK